MLRVILDPNNIWSVVVLWQSLSIDGWGRLSNCVPIMYTYMVLVPNKMARNCRYQIFLKKPTLCVLEQIRFMNTVLTVRTIFLFLVYLNFLNIFFYIQKFSYFISMSNVGPVGGTVSMYAVFIQQGFFFFFSFFLAHTRIGNQLICFS